MTNNNLINLFLVLANVNHVTGKSRLVCTDEFIGDYQCLQFGNGGSWCRFDSAFAKKYKIISIKRNGIMRLSWDSDNDMAKLKCRIDDLILKGKLKKEKGVDIKYIKLCGYQNNKHARPISTTVRKFFRGKPCVVCGTTDRKSVV